MRAILFIFLRLAKGHSAVSRAAVLKIL